MAYIINNDGSSGYTRAQFVAALGGLQPLLASGQNIKTINGQSVLGAGNLQVSAREYSYDLTSVEQGLQADAKAFLDAVNPVQLNGKHKYFSFIFLTDLHDGGYYAGEGGNTYNEHAIKLAGSIAHDCGVSAVFCGGDLSRGGDVDFGTYTNNLEIVRQLFDTYISVPHYVTCGNHDRKYSKTSVLRDNDTWLAYLKRFNSDGAQYYNGKIHAYNDTNNVHPEGYTSNSYAVDFPEYKIRVFVRDNYETVQEQLDLDKVRYAGDVPGYTYSENTVYYGGSFLFPEDLDYTLLSVSHNAGGNPIGAYAGWIINQYLNTKHGKAAVGEIYGHVHSSATHTMTDGCLRSLSVWNLFARKRAEGSEYPADDYHFSIFVIDTDNWMLREFKVGKLYDIDNNSYYDSVTGRFSYPIRHN
jgi:hypothetical protein